MSYVVQVRDAALGFVELGGWVVALLLVLSVVSGAVVLWKLWQLHAFGVGRHAPLLAAIAANDEGQTARAFTLARTAPSHLGPLLVLALQAKEARERLYTMAEARLARLEAGGAPAGFRRADRATLGPFRDRAWHDRRIPCDAGGRTGCGPFDIGRRDLGCADDNGCGAGRGDAADGGSELV